MKKYIITLSLASCLLFLGSKQANAQHKIFNSIEKGDTLALNTFIAQGGDMNILVKKVGEKGTGKRKGNKIDYEMSLLEWAAVKNQLAMVNILLLNKQKFSDSKTLISKAFAMSASIGNEALTKTLLANGADINYPCMVCSKQTALQITLGYKYYPLFYYLLQHGADVNVINSKGEGLLHTATYVENKDIVDTLIRRGVAINLADTTGFTPVMAAALYKNLDLFNFFVSKNANLNLYMSDHSSILLVAAEGGNVDIIKLLLDKGFKINEMNSMNATPLLIATANQNVDAVKLLLSKGADVDVADADDYYPLCYALEVGNTAIARLLIDNGASVHIHDVLKEAKAGKIKDKDFLQYLEEKVKK